MVQTMDYNSILLKQLYLVLGGVHAQVPQVHEECCCSKNAVVGVHNVLLGHYFRRCCLHLDQRAGASATGKQCVCCIRGTHGRVRVRVECVTWKKKCCFLLTEARHFRL